MSSSAIAVTGLGKCYRIGEAQRAEDLRDRLSRLARTSWRRLRGHGSEGVREFWALRDITLDIRAGEVVGIVGPNGAGKSTLLKILSRVTPPTEGSAELEGRVSSLLEVGTGFHPELTGRDNIFLNGAILGMLRSEIRQKFDAIVSFAELEQFIDTPVKHYSSGMFVRLAFSVAAHLDPEILIVDEVLSVGDLNFRNRCLGRLQGLRDQGRTVLFVSHDLTSVRQLCTRALLVESGRLVDDGTPDAITRRYEAQYQGSTSATPGSATRAHAPAGYHLERVELRRAGGQVTDTFDAGETIEVHLWGSGRAPDSSFAVEFHLLNEAERIISYGAANPVGSTYYSADQRHFVCALGPLPLTEGVYRFTFIVGVWNMDRWDRWENAVSFRIARCDPFGTGHSITCARDGDFVIGQRWFAGD